MTNNKHSLVMGAIGMGILLSVILLESPTEAKANAVHRSAKVHTESSLTRQAQRLQKRVQKWHRVKPTISSLEHALTTRRNYMKSALTVHFDVPDAPLADWTIGADLIGSWIVFKPSAFTPTFSLDTRSIAETIAFNPPEGLKAPEHGMVTEVRDDKGVLRANVEGTAVDGYRYNVEEIAADITDALDDSAKTVDIPIAFEPGQIVLVRDGKEQQLTRLSTGRSNFEYSPWGRKANIRKALSVQHISNVVIPQGETYSFNSMLGGPVSQSRGWFDSLIIVNGVDLEPAAGGGICQAATTVYRAAMLAGLPIDERANHSLYVTYYKKYGVGLDATIFPGKQDLNFTNDTPGDILVMSATAGDEAWVEFFGIDDGREVELEGPYFAATAPVGMKVNNRPLRSNEIVWQRTVRYNDGRTEAQQIASQYNKGFSQKLAKEYPASVGIAELMGETPVHAAGPEVSMQQ